MIDEAGIRDRYQALALAVDERVRLLVVAAEALAKGRVAADHSPRDTRVAATGDRCGPGSYSPPWRGTEAHRRARPELASDKLVEPTSRGDPDSPLRLDLQERVTGTLNPRLGLPLGKQ